ncbi:MAG: dephospho-CoA kinase [Oscillospiraceae bacterium]|nr:dephospho-CoA kinase [Oscillospiraceae bacterium]
MRFIGITGGVGAGKTELAQYLGRNYNSRIMSADEIAHDMMAPGGTCYEKTRALFGPFDVWQDDGSLDRAKMADVLFTNEVQRHALNAHIHPAVKAYAREVATREFIDEKLDLLVFETPFPIFMDYWPFNYRLWYLDTPEKIRRERVKKSRGYSDERIDEIIASQPTEDDYLYEATHVIENSGPPQEMFIKAERLLEQLYIEPTEKVRKTADA